MSEYKLYLDNRSGAVQDLPTTEVDWVTHYSGKPSDISFSYIKDAGAKVEVGAIVHFEVDGVLLFRGFVFRTDTDSTALVQVKAYDQIIYLVKNVDTFIFDGKTASEIIQVIAGKYGLKLGAIEDTKYKIKKIYENKKLLDIIEDALDVTMQSTGKLYILSDKKGELVLEEIGQTQTNVMIGDKMLVTSYSSVNSIDKDTYNKIKIAKKNKKTAQYENFEVQDGGTMAQWGTLQRYEVAEETETDAAILKRAEAMLNSSNRIEETLSLESIGHIELSAGKKFFLSIEGVYNSEAFITMADHKFQNHNHTMRLEVFK